MSSAFRGFRIVGRVQGVFFRQSTRLEAQRLQLRGTARNLEDGSVEVFAEGEPDALERFRQWLHRGPPQARVDTVESLPAEEGQRASLPSGFKIL